MPLVVDRSVELAAAPADVFAFVTDHARLAEWAPAVARVVVDGRAASEPNGPGTLRTLVPRWGRAGTEVVRELDRGARRLVYSATDASLGPLCRAHRATLTCDVVDGGTRLRFVVEAQPRAVVLFWLARAMFALGVRASIRNLVRRFGVSSAH